MDVSVFISCYNQELYVAQAIESVLNQDTKFRYEIVVSDDASTDNSKRIILDYERKYPEKIRSVIYEKNIGLIQNFINFVKNAKGEYLAFCEGDDWWINQNRIEDQTNFLKKNPDYVLTFGSKYHYYQNIGKKIIPTEFRPKFTNSIDFLDSHLDLFYIHTSTIMVPRIVMLNFVNTLDKIKHKAIAWDYPLFFYLPSQGKINFKDKMYSVHRKLSTSITGQINDYSKHYDIYVQNTYRIYFYLFKLLKYPNVIREKLYYNYGNHCINFGLILSKKNIFKRGIKIIENCSNSVESKMILVNKFIDAGFLIGDFELIGKATSIINSENLEIDYLRKLKILASKNILTFKLLTFLLKNVKDNKYLIRIFVKN